MSVLARLRGETSVDFIDNAIKLAEFTKRQCTNEKIIPKSHTFYGGTRLYDTSMEIVSRVVRANSIYARNKSEAQLRRNEMLLARSALEDLIVQVGIMHRARNFPMDILQKWAELLYDEERLLNGILDSDSRKAKTLPD